MRHRFAVRVGETGFRVGAPWAGPIAALRTLYAGYPSPEGDVPGFTVGLEPTRPWRRWLRPSLMITGDFHLPEAAPLPLRQGLLAAEMGMNLQMALGQRRFLLLHAASIEREGRAVILTGLSGSGKSTLAALLMLRGWRLLGDEFALLDPGTGLLHPFPRPVSLKNESVAAVAAAAGRAGAATRFGPWLRGTPKGDIRHLVPDAASLAAMTRPARPVAVLFPRWGFEPATRAVAPSEVFVRLTQASTNYVALGEAAFRALTTLATQVPATAIDYPDADTAIAQVERVWDAAG